jgi:hypothetical protein
MAKSNAVESVLLFPISKTIAEPKEVKSAVGTPGVVEKKIPHTFTTRYIMLSRITTDKIGN